MNRGASPARGAFAKRTGARIKAETGTRKFGHYTEAEDELLRRLYADPSIPLEEIARRMTEANGGTMVRGWHSVKNRRMALGIPARPRDRSRNGVVPAIPSEREAEFKLLWNRGATYHELMRTFGCSKSAVQQNRIRLQLPARKQRGEITRDIKFHMYTTYAMSVAMERRAQERQTSVAEYVRYLIARDCGL